jgi:hypothetical protein
MLTQGRDVFLWIPTEGPKRDCALIQGAVLEVNPQSFVAQFLDPITPAVGTKVFAHAEVGRKFMQQAATVQAVLEADANPVIAFTRDSEPISADERHAFRVSLVAACLPAQVDEDDECLLLDVSATGFGVSSTTPFKLGDVVKVQLAYNGEGCAGLARIQSARPLYGSKFRYGLHALEAPRGQAANDLQAGLARISASVQREQLRRLARA